MITEFVNLTNGIEIIPELTKSSTPYGFVRIQSTFCEQKMWGNILLDLDYTFLLPLARGLPVTVYDYGAKKEISRAIYQGLEWIRYALNRRWHGINNDKIYVRKHNVTTYFSEQYDMIDSKIFKKLDYFKRFLCTNRVLLSGQSASTTHDSDYEYYVKLLKEESEKRRRGKGDNCS